ncbi:Rossmann fold domain-containing protein [Erythrobacter sp. JK5]|uniref:Rossmann fold domain-containing protein n=1 Tax=Erythrobacter sp. JK5 TaxID=2829500 RepID=UPI001BA9EA4E|nr:hypothetical protein [Erythrobacter sp. JK5]QUL39213.1 hypothetical protein KDC96_07835 [Erythrobacter sp. JK5]
MAQAVQIVEDLPDRAIDAAAAFFSNHLVESRRLLADDQTDSLAIVLLPMPHHHDDWRRSLARDLARAHAPSRVNVVGATAGEAREEMLAYLRDAPGVTGQYLAAHE